MHTRPQYKTIVEYERNNLIEQTHYGIILHLNKNKIINKIGEDYNYKFYHRSCMKPLQMSVMIDIEADKKFGLTQEEIAVCCASHTGDLVHQEKVLSILKKIKCDENDLLCNPHEPLSIEEQHRLIKNNLKARKIHNNCSGKHAGMLAICKTLDIPIKNYTDISHPLTQIILNKVCNLCETNLKEVIVSKDGCSLPVIATSLEELGKGFLNLFTNQKYSKITNAYLNFPYLIGGKNRLDSEIINITNNIAAKVGAGGLCVVVNIKKQECIVIKIADSNMEARAIATVHALSQAKWPEFSDLSSDQINNIYKKEIVSQHNELLGLKKATFTFFNSL